MFFFLIVETSGKINCVFDESTVNPQRLSCVRNDLAFVCRLRDHILR